MAEYTRSTKAYYGEIRVLEGAGLDLLGNASRNSAFDPSRTVVKFPHPPKTIDLSRDNTYNNVGNSLVTPDGIWIYQSTSPLEIPVEFTMHAFDEITNGAGPKALFDVAAILESMMLPVNRNPMRESTKAANAGPDQNTGASDESQARQSQDLNKIGGQYAANAASAVEQAEKDSSQYAFPPACVLRLASVGEKKIEVVGLVKSVAVKFNEPFLAVADDNNSYYNMPSSATYSFRFIANATYSNDLSNFNLQQMFAGDVKQHLHNNWNYAAATNNGYIGVGQSSR